MEAELASRMMIGPAWRMGSPLGTAKVGRASGAPLLAGGVLEQDY